MDNKEIEELLNHAGAPCVTIVIPVHRLSPGRKKDPAIVKKVVEHAKALAKITYEGGSYDMDDLMKRIDEVSNSIDYAHAKEGVGIYVSPNIARLMNFPFEVVEKVKVGDVFDSRDLLYYKTGVLDYNVLSISKKHLHLYEGKGDELTEIKNEDFPVDYEDDWEYSKPNRGQSYGTNTVKEFERDKSIMEEIRFVDFLRNADKKVGKYANNPLVVAGGAEEIADYEHVTKHSDKIIGKVVGNYGLNGELQLEKRSWEEAQHSLENRNKALLLDLQELIGKKLLATGVSEVWDAVNAGNALQLVVEKDYERGGFIVIDANSLKFHKPFGNKKFVHVNDAVERIIKLVLRKKGKVVFVNNGELKNFDGIALHLRYNNSGY